jgi:hypothetical protein
LDYMFVSRLMRRVFFNLLVTVDCWYRVVCVGALDSVKASYTY